MTLSSIPAHLTPEGIAARDAAVKLLWDKRSMQPEHSEEIVQDVIDAVAPFLAPWLAPDVGEVCDIFVAVARYGALGLAEFSQEQRGLTTAQARALFDSHLSALGPGDRVAVTLARPGT